LIMPAAASAAAREARNTMQGDGRSKQRSNKVVWNEVSLH
jgi:hypothetical protein